jgi:hypothetical protein
MKTDIRISHHPQRDDHHDDDFAASFDYQGHGGTSFEAWVHLSDTSFDPVHMHRMRCPALLHQEVETVIVACFAAVKIANLPPKTRFCRKTARPRFAKFWHSLIYKKLFMNIR